MRPEPDPLGIFMQGTGNRFVVWGRRVLPAVWLVFEGQGTDLVFEGGGYCLVFGRFKSEKQ